MVQSRMWDAGCYVTRNGKTINLAFVFGEIYGQIIAQLTVFTPSPLPFWRCKDVLRIQMV